MSLGIPAILVIAQIAVLPDAVQQQTFPAADAREYVGRSVTLEGTVVGVRVTDRGTAFIDLEHKAPHQAISAVVHADAVSGFPDLKGFIGKRVLISGLVMRTARGIEMILDRPAQLRMAPEPNRVPCGSR